MCEKLGISAFLDMSSRLTLSSSTEQGVSFFVSAPFHNHDIWSGTPGTDLICPQNLSLSITAHVLGHAQRKSTMDGAGSKFFRVCTMHVCSAQRCQNHVYGLILSLILQVVSPSK